MNLSWLKKKPKFTFKPVHVFLLMAVLLITYLSLSKDSNNKIPVQINNQTIYAELADNNQKRALGLMGRKKLAHNDGMLFVFDQETRHSFWMKNTKIPLDIVWINRDKTIVHIEHSAPPCPNDPCLSYRSTEPAMYVLEVNGGWAIQNGVNIGDTAIFD